MNGRRPNPWSYKIAILWRGDAEAHRHAAPQYNRFYRIFEELAALGICAEPAVYDKAFADVPDQAPASIARSAWRRRRDLREENKPETPRSRRSACE